VKVHRDEDVAPRLPKEKDTRSCTKHFSTVNLCHQLRRRWNLVGDQSSLGLERPLGYSRRRFLFGVLESRARLGR
jgi:hypothetical protein